MKAASFTALTGTALVLIYTALISSADGITKLLAGGYAAPQLYAVSGGLVALFCVIANRISPAPGGLRTTQPRAMAVRAVATVVAGAAFFYAFRLLPFAEVFIFIGLMPLVAGLMSGPILRERVAPRVWIALAAGFVGVLCLFPEGLTAVTLGHAVAFLACISGTLSMVMARYVGRREANSLALVFYPNLLNMIVMAIALPFVFRPMPLGDLGLAVAYAGLLFGARWLLVVALRLLPAYTATPLMNLQFVWMVIIGAAFFGEVPGAHIFLGAAVVVASGSYLVYEQFAAQRVRRAPPMARSVMPPAE
ncbi:membrane protein, putative [Pseudooceanicola batsensis HTCC2597]|uniref:Membrane protein, putative n=1 Tax=Pseudooceanicola batsensis (strain ATCC BAA-863 / DSM 15984 / KCTC 12145 / HTCC2597) TaxID=252305 RepID=A3TX65_PSEBH|nr:DMT family transporter [Pseudooceanicola batsensis]EAQ03425.1 membrane protein, putative [Pseudooceanicola batsensis HTCC2597]